MRSPWAPPRRAWSVSDQRGSVVIIVASVLMIMGALMVSIQMGYDYLVEQRLQKAADLAALSAVQRLKMLTCNQDDLNTLAGAVASQNGGNAVQVDSVGCGRWSGVPNPSFQSASTGTNEEPLNAIRVQASETAVSLLPSALGGGSGGKISATSTAVVGPPVATFSVGAQLLSLQPNGLTANILRGIGLSPDQLTVLNSAGLANVMITPSGLLQALGLPPTVIAGIGTPTDLAKLHNLTLGDLLTAYGTVLGQANPAGVSVSAVQSVLAQIAAGPLNVPVQLFGDNGILANVVAGSSDGATAMSSALEAQVGLSDLIGATVIAANGENSVDVGTSIPGVASVKAKVVTPPTIAVGPVGTSASNAQVQIQLKVDLLGLSTLNLVLVKLGLVDLTVNVDVGNSTGTVRSISFDDDSAGFSAASSAVNLCIGNLATGPCEEENAENNLTPGTVAELSLLAGAVPVADVQAKGYIPLTSGHSPDGDFTFIHRGDDGTVDSDVSGTQGVDGTRIQVTSVLLGGALDFLTKPIVNTALGVVVSAVSGLLVNLLSNQVLPLVAGLVGANIGQTQIHLYDITRGAPYLVQ